MKPADTVPAAAPWLPLTYGRALILGRAQTGIQAFF